MNIYFLVKFSVPSKDGELLRALLADRLSWGWEEEEKKEYIEFKLYLPSKEAAEELSYSLSSSYPNIYLYPEIKKIEEKDWAVEWKKFFSPIEVEGVFSIIPPWLYSSSQQKTTPLIIHPQMAFGTGHHPTTRLCLEAIIHLWKKRLIGRDNRFLDLGTGSGILGIACSKLGLKGIGIDIDPMVRENLLTNIRLNNIQEDFLPLIGTSSCLKKHKKFHLILANILLNPLLDMAEELISLLMSRGILVLSGILKEQEEILIKGYSALIGLPILKLYKDNWACLIWQREK